MITSAELVRQVRSQIQETNINGPISDDTIYDALNRGLDYGWDLLARNYKAPILSQSETLVFNSDGEYVLPDGIFEDRLLKVELLISGGARSELLHLSYQDTTGLQSTGLGGTPTAYTLVGRTIKALPAAGAAGRSFVIWYLREVERIVPLQGRVTSFTAADPDTSANATVVVDAVGEDISITDSYNKYINFIDFETGEVRGSAQVQSINGTQLTLKLTPTRSTVINKTISADIPTDLEVDDYICGIEGSCVLYFNKPLSNFIIQYAVMEIRRSLGYDVGVEKSALKELENQVNYTFGSRPSTARVKRRSRIWSKNYPNNWSD